MLTICSSCGLLSSARQHRSGCRAANNRSPRRSASMAELTDYTDTSLFTTPSNEHTLFAGTLRDWADPLLQGQEPTRMPLCPRCVACKCESLKDLPNSSANLNHHHHHHRHVPSCPNLRHHERAKTSSRQCLANKPKRRAYSCDSSIPLNSHTSLIKQSAEHSSSPPPPLSSSTQLPQRKKSISKIPVRIPSATSSSTAPSEYSSVSSINENGSSVNKSKIPRAISNQNLTSTNHVPQTNQILSSSNEDLDQDSLNDNVYQRTSPKSIKDISPKKKKKNMMMMYCTSHRPNDFDHNDEEILMKKKNKMSLSSKKPSQNDSSPSKYPKTFWYKEGRHSKSKTAGTAASPINDLSSTTSSSSSSSFTNNCSSTNSLRKKSRPYRLASPSQSIPIPSLSDDSLSEQYERLSKKRRPRSAFIAYDSTPRSSRFESTPPPPPPPSVYLIELTNNHRSPNSFGLTKTLTYVWKNSPKKKGEKDLNTYPKYSVEQISPTIDQNQRPIPVSSRHITLQRGKTDYWQNMKTSPDSILTSSCQNHTGSASNLLSPTLNHKHKDIKRRPNSNGHVISITTTKRRQPSLLNQSQNTQWNIEGDGKQLRYSNLKWFSVDQLEKDHRIIPKQRIKRKQQTSDSTTDTGSSSEQYNQSAPPILQQKSHLHLTKEIHPVFETPSMNKQSDPIIPDYSSFHREINDTSSPINHNEQPQQQTDSSSSSSSKEMQHFETIINENSSPPKLKLNSYASTDEDVEELNLDYSDDIDRSTTIQTYRDRLNTRLNTENHGTRSRMLSTEYPQTIDSGIDILTDQKTSQPKLDEQYSQQTTNQNDLFALSDDSLLDIESPPIHDLLSKTPPTTMNEQLSSLTDESDEGKSYSTVLTDYRIISKTERGLTNTSEQYYSAESDFNTSLDPYSGYELENLSDEDEEDKIKSEISPEIPRSPSPKFDFQLPSFGDWIDQVFTNFLAEARHQSASSSRTSSMVSIHTSQNTIDTSSSQVLTVIENNPIHSSHRRSLSWPNNEQQQDEQKFKEVSSSSLNNENTGLHCYPTENIHKRSEPLIKNNDEEVINNETMQNNSLHDHTPHTTTNTNQTPFDDENFSFSNPPTNIDAEKVEETEHSNDEKHVETGVDNDDDNNNNSSNRTDKPFVQAVMADDSSTFSFYEKSHSREPQQHQHTNSHDSLLQADHHILDNINTTASSTEDLSTTHQLSSSVFHSKDSALGLSDDNLNYLPSNQFIIMDDDDGDDDDQQQEEQILSSSPLKEQDDQTVENNVIQDTANNNIDQHDMTCEHNHDNSQTNNNNKTMIWINDQPQFISSSHSTELNGRTISTSSSEQLIPIEKQTGMYFPAFGTSAAIHLAEKYNCEWLQDVTTPPSTIRKSSSIVENDELTNSRVFRQHQSIGDDDEFVVTFQTLQPSYSCPNLTSSIPREPLRERSYSLTTLDAYARLDITRDTLEQMWLSLLDLAFSDNDDIELGEYKLRHIQSLSNSYTNINKNLIEKSRSHGDIFSTTNKTEKFPTTKSKSFDVTSLPQSTTDNSANVGLLQGAAISEPFVDRVYSISVHSDTEPNLLDVDNDSIQSFEQDNPPPDEEYSPINQITSPIVKEPLNYVFRYRHHLDKNNDDDEYDLEHTDDITNYLPERTVTTNQTIGEEEKQLCMSLGFDDEEATAAFAAADILQTNTAARLAEYRPHSLSTIPSSRESQYESSIDDSDDIIDRHENLRTSTIRVNQEEFRYSEHSENEEEEEEDKGESTSDSSQSRPHSPIQLDQNQEIKPSNFTNIDHNAWDRSISAPIYSEDLSNEHNNDEDFFTFTDNLTTVEQSPLDQTNLTDSKATPTLEQTDENNLIDFSSQENPTETMDSQQENKSTNSTHTSLSSIHDTHLDPNELAYRLARLDTLNISSPPKLTFADELAELGEKRDPFENDSLDHSPTRQEKEQNESVLSTPHTYSTTPLPTLHIDELTSIVKDIREINQEKSIASLCLIVEDIHAHTNNQFLTKIVNYHQSPPIANLQTIITELHQTPIGKSIPRPQRPTHLQLDKEEEEEDDEDTEEEEPSPVIIDSIPISSNIISDLEQQLASYKTKSPSPPPAPLLLPMARRISEPPIHSTRYHTQRIDKVSDLEIVKQGKGFKIGYVDRQGTDQRVILTKRIEAGPDIMARDPHIRLPYKGRKILNQVYSSVLHTNGYNTIQEDKKFQHLADDIEVPIIGTNPQHFDESDMISIDIDGPSTMLNSICESIVITQGSVYSTNPPKPSPNQPLIHSNSKSIFDNNLSHSSSSRLRHVVLDQHEEYLLDSSRTPTPSNKKDKIEVIDTWKDRTVIDGSSATWRSPSLQTYKATKHIQPSNPVQHLNSTIEPNTVQMRIAPSHDVKYRTSEHIEIPAVYDWNDPSIDTPRKQSKITRDIALSPILMDKKQYQTSSTSPIKIHQKVDRSCQYSPPGKRDFGLQCHFENFTSSTQVSLHDIPNFLITSDGTQTINDANPPFDDSGIQTNIQIISPALSIASSENHQTTQPYTLSGADFIRKLNEQRTQASALTVTQYTDGNYYLASNDNHQTGTNIPPTTLERSADSGILVDEQLSRHRPNKANFALQVDIKGSSSDSEDVSEVTQRPIHRSKPSTNGDMYEHHSELLITTRNSSKSRQNSSSNDKRVEQPRTSSPKEIEQQILQLRRERAHILDLLALNWSRSNIWVELTEAKLNYIIGETDALLRSLSFDATPDDSERVKSKVHQYEEEMADLTRQRLAVYRERLEDSKKQLDMKIDELELKKSSVQHHPSHYSTLEYIPRMNNTSRSKSFLSTSAENLTSIPLQETVSNHPQFLDISFLTSTNQSNALPPRYPRSSRLSQHQQQQSSDTYRTVYRPTPRYPSTITISNETRYDYPRYRTTSLVTPTGNLSGMQGLSQSQQAILDETDKLVKDSQQFHHESASQFERARESLLSSETSIRLARANMAASRLSPNSSYLPNDITLAELFKYEQSLAKETAKNTRTYSSISTSAES